MLALLRHKREIAVAHNGLPEDQRLRYSTTERGRKVARIWEQLQQGARPIRRLRRPGVRFTEDGIRQERCVVVSVSTA